MQENKVAKYNGGLIQRIDNTLSVTNKLLSLGLRKDLVDYFVNNPWFFCYTVHLFYPFNDQLIDKYFKIWRFDLFSINPSVKWSEVLIDKYINEWDWNELSRNIGLRWSEFFIDKYFNKWNWKSIGENKAIHWSPSLIDKYANLLSENNNKEFFIGLSLNDLSLCKEHIFKKYEKLWDWEQLSENSSIQWTSEMVAKYKDRISFGNLNYNKNQLSHFIYDYIDNNFFKVCTNAIQYEWKCLSKNTSVLWSEAFIEKFKNKWDWCYISGNSSLPWSDKLINKYIDQWNWGCLSENQGLPWSEELIDKYADRWDFSAFHLNDAIIWSESLIDKYLDKWYWGGIVNAKVPFTESFIEKYRDFLPWSEAKFNCNLPWSISLLKKYQISWGQEDSLIPEELLFWQKILEPQINDSLIEEVMERI